MEFVYVLKPSRLSMLTEGATEEESRVLSKHAQYMDGLAKKGVVEFAGRTQNEDESTFGLVVFHAQTEAAAQQLMADDPAVKHGVMTARLFPYKIAFRAAQ